MAFEKIGITKEIRKMLIVAGNIIREGDKRPIQAGLSIESMHARLVELFPDREESGMLITVKDQVYRQLPERYGNNFKGITAVAGGKVKLFWVDLEDESIDNAYKPKGRGRPSMVEQDNSLRYSNQNNDDESHDDEIPPVVPRAELEREITKKTPAVAIDSTVMNALMTQLGVLQVNIERESDRSAKLAIRVKELEEADASAVKKIRIKVTERPAVEIEGMPHPQLEYVLKLVNTRPDPNNENIRMNVLLIGPAGSGKTFLAEQVAKCLELRYGFITVTAGMSEGQLLGRMLPGERTPVEVARLYHAYVEAGMPDMAASMACAQNGFRYIRSEFVKRYEKGGVYLLDEVDAGDANTLMILNTAMAGGKIYLPNRPEKPYAIRHPDFILICAANTFGNGADRLYVGRNQLDAAFIDRLRMGQVEINYDPRIENFLCPDKNLRKWLQAIRTNCTQKIIRRIISSRFLRDAYACKMNGVSYKEIRTALFGGWSGDEITKAEEGIKIPTDGNEEEDGEESEIATVGEFSPGAIPYCPKHPTTPMVRTKSNNGWRCNIPGNKYEGAGKWTICNQIIWDRRRS